MMTNFPTKRIKAISHANNFYCFTYKMAGKKPAGIDKKRNYVTVILCIVNGSPASIESGKFVCLRPALHLVRKDCSVCDHGVTMCATQVPGAADRSVADRGHGRRR